MRKIFVIQANKAVVWLRLQKTRDVRKNLISILLLCLRKRKKRFYKLNSFGHFGKKALKITLIKLSTMNFSTMSVKVRPAGGKRSLGNPASLSWAYLNLSYDTTDAALNMKLEQRCH